MEQKVQTNVETETTTTPEVENNSEKVVKTFTQEDVDKIISERLAKEKKKQPSAEELKEFNDWKESKKTEAEKQEEIKKELEAAKKELALTNNKIKVSNAKVKEKFQSIVLNEVLNMEGDFDTNLESYLQKYAEFVENETPTQKTTTGVAVQQISAKDTGVKSILKNRHPDLFD